MDSDHERSILIINPNTSQAMTDSLQPLIKSLGYRKTHFEYFTAPSGVPSINNESDAEVSSEACLSALKPLLKQHSAFLVCCYSAHPLVPHLRSELANLHTPNKPVTGIFEASVATCLTLINPYDTFGIVSTGAQWEEILGEAVGNLLGENSERYAGTKTTGLNADELHSTPWEEVERRLKKATKQILETGAKAICLGCAGMSGMDKAVREACIEALGEDLGSRVRIIDGVLAGVNFLEGALRAGF